MQQRLGPLGVQRGDLLLDGDGVYWGITNTDDPAWLTVERFGKRQTPPRFIDPSMFMTFDPNDLTPEDWRIVSRGHLAAEGDWAVAKEVSMMDDKATDKRPTSFGGTRPTVRVTSQYLRQRGKIGMTLTRDELQHLAELIRAGRVLSKDYRDISKNLRQAMTKLGIDTKGL